MLDGADAPHAHLVGFFDDVSPLMDDAVIHLVVVAERPLGLAVFLTVGREHRVKLQNNLGFSHLEHL